MPIVKAGPNQYLLIGRDGKLENRGSAVQAILLPGTIYVLVPSTKQETTFEFTQETRDGIPLRFKGIILYRITNPVAAARLFDFSTSGGITQINAMLTHICLGELRDTVSHMSMAECIEQRKTTLSRVVADALQRAIAGQEGGENAWGIEVEVAQTAQVFIVDAELRKQLEAEVRNEIKVKSDQSNIRSQEEIRLTNLASESRLQEKKLASDKENLRRQEEMELAQLARQRRMQAENLESERQAMQIEQEKFRLQMESEQERVQADAPLQLLKIEKQVAILQEQLAMLQLQNQVKALETDGTLLLERARQELRREILPLEQAPQIAAAASKVLQGTNLSIYGENSQLLSQLAPIFELLTRTLQPNKAESKQ
jgi:hypothetical protein